MEILKEITKDVFEHYVPAAKMPDRNTSIFERMQNAIQSAYTNLLHHVISQQWEELIDENEKLKDLCVHSVCLDAFVQTIRSLDLVLTATGFGIVSTNSMVPASKVRVDALVEEVRCESILIRSSIVKLMTLVPEWGLSPQAEECIPTLFYRPLSLKQAGLPFTYDNWTRACGIAVEVQKFLSSEISPEYMEELIVKTRTASLDNADIIVINKCNIFTADFIRTYDPTAVHLPNKKQAAFIVEQLESYIDSYPTYRKSRLYAKRHADKYNNRREDSTFFFM